MTQESIISKESIPLVLGNWHTAAAATKSWSTSKNSFEHDYIVDYGGAGIYVPKDFRDHEADGSTNDSKDTFNKNEIVYIKRYSHESQIKFTAGCTTLPFITSQLKVPVVNDDLNYVTPFNNDRIVYHEDSKYMIINDSSKSLSLVKLESSDPNEEDDDFWTPSLLRIESGRRNAFKSSQHDVQNIIIRKCGSKAMLYINCSHVINVCQFEYSDDDSRPAIIELDTINPGKCDISSKSLFKLISPNPHEGLDHEFITLSKSTKDGGKEHLMLYDMTKDCIKWSYEHTSCPKPECKLYNIQNVDYSKIHPRVCFMSDEHSFGSVDMRISSSSAASYRCLLKSGQQNHQMFDFETIFGSALYSGHDHQHIVLSDYHVNLVDDRYPNNSLIQWSHSLDQNNTSERLKYCKSFKLRSTDDSDTHVVSITNGQRVCLLSLSPQDHSSDVTILQPKSLHSPLHVFSLTDCLKFQRLATTENPDRRSFGKIETRLNNSRLDGFEIIPQDDGSFSIFGLSNYRDLFCQDFIERDTFTQYDSWSFGRPGRDLRQINERTQKFLTKCFEDQEKSISDDMSQKDDDDDDDDLCQCCSSWTIGDHTQVTVVNPYQCLNVNISQTNSGRPIRLTQSKFKRRSVFMQKMDSLFAPLVTDPTADSVILKDDKESSPASSQSSVKRKDLPKWSKFSYDLLRAWNIPHINQRIPVVVDEDSDNDDEA